MVGIEGMVTVTLFRVYGRARKAWLDPFLVFGIDGTHGHSITFPWIRKG